MGGMGNESTVRYKRLAEPLVQKRKLDSGAALAWMRCTLSFALIQSAVMAIRGSRSVLSRNPATHIKLGYNECCLGVF